MYQKVSGGSWGQGCFASAERPSTTGNRLRVVVRVTMDIEFLTLFEFLARSTKSKSSIAAHLAMSCIVDDWPIG